MNYVQTFGIVGVLATSLSSRISAGPPTADQKAGDTPIIVTLKTMSYDPKKLEISVGASVVWSNKSHSKHTATSDDDGKTFDTGEIKPDESSTPVKFDKEGEINYHCQVHGKSMSGTIVVTAAEKK